MDRLLNFAGLSFLKGKLEIIFASIFVYKVCSRFPKAGNMLNKPMMNLKRCSPSSSQEYLVGTRDLEATADAVWDEVKMIQK